VGGVVELGIEGTCLKECFFEVYSVRKCSCRECGDASLKRGTGDVFISAIMHCSWIVLVDADIAAVSGDRNEYVVVWMPNGRYASQGKSGLKCRAVQFESGGNTRPEYAVIMVPFTVILFVGTCLVQRVFRVWIRAALQTPQSVFGTTHFLNALRLYSGYTQGVLRVYSRFSNTHGSMLRSSFMTDRSVEHTEASITQLHSRQQIPSSVAPPPLRKPHHC